MTHLSLEQCQKLKEVGFPQDTQWYHVETWSGSKLVFPSSAKYKESKREKLYACPTLDELIEWLQKDLAKPEVIRLDIGNDMTVLRLMLLTPVGKSREIIQETISVKVNSPTPLEAVYNLALVVKGKE